MTYPNRQEDPTVVDPDQAVLDSLLTELHATESNDDLSQRIADAVARGDAEEAALRLAEAEGAQTSDPVAAQATGHDLPRPRPLRSARNAWLSAAVVVLGFGAVLGTLLSDREDPNEPTPGEAASPNRQDPQEGAARTVQSLEELQALLAEVSAIEVNVARRQGAIPLQPVDWIRRSDPADIEALDSDLRVEGNLDNSYSWGMWELPAFQENSSLQLLPGSSFFTPRVPTRYYQMRLLLEDGSHAFALFGLTDQSERVHLMVRGMPTLVTVGARAKERLAEYTQLLDSLDGVVRKPADFARHLDSEQLILIADTAMPLHLSGFGQPHPSEDPQASPGTLPVAALEEIKRCTRLRRLDLSRMDGRLSSQALDAMFRGSYDLPIEGLILRGAKLNDDDAYALTYLVSLRDLDLSRVQEFTGEAFEHYPRSAVQRSDFRTIDLSSVDTLTNKGLAAIAAWGVADLRLADSFGNITEDGWRALMQGPKPRFDEEHGGNPAPALTALDLSGWPLQAGQLMDLARHPTLERLQLNRCELDDEDLALLTAGLAGGSLRQLSLEQNPDITSSGLSKLEDIEGFEVVCTAVQNPAKAKADAEAIHASAQLYYLHNARIPTMQQLTEADENGQTYLVQPVEDPWGRSYVIRERGAGNIEVVSCGPDGISGTFYDVVHPSADGR